MDMRLRVGFEALETLCLFRGCPPGRHSYQFAYTPPKGL